MTDKNTHFDVDKFIKDNYRPVPDKPGYVWFDARRMQIISIDTLKASLENYHPVWVNTSEISRIKNENEDFINTLLFGDKKEE